MSKVDQLAELLLKKFQQEFPLTEDKGAGRTLKKLPEKSIPQRLGQFYKEAREARQQHRVWMINWARVVFKLQQRLLLEGYSQEVVSKLLMAMIFSTYDAN